MRLVAAALLCCCSFAVGQEPLPDLRGSVTVVTFLSALCPVSNAFNDRMSALFRDYSAKGVKFVFADSNANESVAEIEAYRKTAGFPFAVYRDDGNRLADRFGAMATPETYVLDAQGAVRYHGFIEDSVNEARVKRRAVRDVLDAMLAGKRVPVAETKAFGCSIKRVR